MTKGQRTMSMLTADQIRAARAMLRWSARELAVHSSVHLTTIQRMEGQHNVLRGRIATRRRSRRRWRPLAWSSPSRNAAAPALGYKLKAVAIAD